MSVRRNSGNIKRQRGIDSASGAELLHDAFAVRSQMDHGWLYPEERQNDERKIIVCGNDHTITR